MKCTCLIALTLSLLVLPVHANTLHDCMDAAECKRMLDAGADVNARDDYGFTPLHSCLDAGACKLLLEAGAQVDARDDYGHTPLHLADDAGVAQLLIQAGADINATHNDGASILYSASVRGSADVVRLLLENGVKTGNLNELLREVCTMGHPEVARLLIQAGADVRTADREGNTLLHYACGYPNYRDSVPGLPEPRKKLVEMLLQAGCSPHARNKYGQTPLHTACSTDGNPGCVEALLLAGAEVSATGCYLRNEGGSCESTAKIVAEGEEATPLHLAVWNQSHACIPALLAAGAETQAKDSRSRSAMDLFKGKPSASDDSYLELLADASEQHLIRYATERDAAVILRILHKRGVDLSQPLDEKQNTALHLVFSSETAGLLLELGADVHAENKAGQAPLNCTISADIIRLLLSHGAKVNKADSSGNTVLNRVIRFRDAELIQLLLDAGAELNPHHAMPPLHTACMQGNLPMVKLFLNKGADPQLKCPRGRTALDYAKSYHHQALIELLQK